MGAVDIPRPQDNDGVMVRALVLAMLAVSAGAAADRRAGVLHITVVLVDADGTSTPVPRHALLVSDTPSRMAAACARKVSR